MPIKTSDLESLPDSETICLRCKIPMKNKGVLSLLEGGETLSLVEPGLQHFDRLEVECYICARCGKLEFFV